MDHGFWDDAPLIHTYTRAQALTDGVLLDVTPTAREAGFGWPVALTAAAWADTVAWEESNAALQDVEGRLWDVLTMARCAVVAHVRASGTAPTGALAFTVYRVPNDLEATEATPTTLRLLYGPGDDGEPVLTITVPGED